jgi:hypothetical protein
MLSDLVMHVKRPASVEDCDKRSSSALLPVTLLRLEAIEMLDGRACERGREVSASVPLY